MYRNVRVRKEEFGGLIIKGREIRQVDSIGFEILSQVKNNIEIDKIIEHMKKKYEGDPHQIESDIYRFLENMSEGGVLEIEKD